MKKEFILVFDDSTFESTNGANIEEIISLYTNELIRVSDGSLKKCVRVEDKEVFELKHRLRMISADIDRVIDFIDEERLMERFQKATPFADHAMSLIENIYTACDLSSDESLSWINK